MKREEDERRWNERNEREGHTGSVGKVKEIRRGEGIFEGRGVGEKRKESLARGRDGNEGNAIPHEPLEPVSHHLLCPSTLLPSHSSSNTHSHISRLVIKDQRLREGKEIHTWRERVGTVRMTHTIGGRLSPSTSCTTLVSRLSSLSCPSQEQPTQEAIK